MPVLFLGSGPPSDDEDDLASPPLRATLCGRNTLPDTMATAAAVAAAAMPDRASPRGHGSLKRTRRFSEPSESPSPPRPSATQVVHHALPHSLPYGAIDGGEGRCGDEVTVSDVHETFTGAGEDGGKTETVTTDNQHAPPNLVRRTGNPAVDGAAAIAAVLARPPVSPVHDGASGSVDGVEGGETFEDWTKRQIWETGANYGNLWQSDIADIRHWR